MEALVDGRVVEEASTARLLPSLGAAVHAVAVPTHATMMRMSMGDLRSMKFCDAASWLADR
jgi:hypothetical protein